MTASASPNSADPKHTDSKDTDPKDSKPKKTSSSATTVIAAILAVLAGIGTVYWLLGPPDNDFGSRSGAQKPASTRADVSASPLKGLNRGAMAAFIVRPAPMDVGNFSFENAKGEKLTGADLKGKVILLNIWATWCVPCRDEMPQLNALQAELGGDQFEVVAISIDKGGPEKAEKFLSEIDVTDLAFYYDPTGKLFATLKAVGMPTTLLLDPQGKEIGRLVGPADWAAPAAKTLVKAAISAAKTATP